LESIAGDQCTAARIQQGKGPRRMARRRHSQQRTDAIPIGKRHIGTGRQLLRHPAANGGIRLAGIQRHIAFHQTRVSGGYIDLDVGKLCFQSIQRTNMVIMDMGQHDARQRLADLFHRS